MDLDAINLFVIAAATLAIAILAFIASFFLWPSALIRFFCWFWCRALGMQVRYAYHEDYRFCYMHRGRPGSKPSLLLLHGFSANKDMWLPVVRFFPKNLHLICVDLPGHEGTTRLCSDDYSINGQVKRIHQFVESIKLNRKPFHLVGVSAGGTLAGVYAAQYPSDICSLSLICPGGLQNPKKTKYIKQLKDLNLSKDLHKLPLIPSSPQEVEDTLKLCSYVRFKIPQQILRGYVDERIPHNEFYKKVFLELSHKNSRYALHQNLNKILVPTQVIWGKQDEVLDASGADIIANAIPDSQVCVLENCGHMVVLEQPRKTAKFIMDFLSLTHSHRE